MRQIRFAASDDHLRKELSPVISHLHGLSRGREITFGFFHCLGDTFESYGKDDLSVICISALPNDPGIRIIREEQSEGRACGIIMRTEDRELWAKLVEAHAKTPLLFIVATGGPKEKFKEMFPGIHVECFSDLDPPFDKRVADFIFKSVAERPVS